MSVTVKIFYGPLSERPTGSSRRVFKCEPACYIHELERHLVELGFVVARRAVRTREDDYGIILNPPPVKDLPAQFESRVQALQNGDVWAASSPDGRAALGATEADAILRATRSDPYAAQLSASYTFAFIQQKRRSRQMLPLRADDVAAIWVVKIDVKDATLQPHEVLPKLRAAITEWAVETPDGEKAWAAAKDDLNIADFFAGVAPSVNRYLHKHGIRSVQVVYKMQEGEAIDFDESLVDVDRLEAMKNPMDFLPVFLTTDQPPTCPKCGSRVDCDPNLAAQIVKCAGSNCGFEYRLEDDEDSAKESREARRDRLEILALTHGRLLDYVDGKWYWRPDTMSHRSRPFDTRWLALLDATEGLSDDKTDGEDPF